MIKLPVIYLSVLLCGLISCAVYIRSKKRDQRANVLLMMTNLFGRDGNTANEADVAVKGEYTAIASHEELELRSLNVDRKRGYSGSATSSFGSSNSSKIDHGSRVSDSNSQQGVKNTQNIGYQRNDTNS